MDANGTGAAPGRGGGSPGNGGNSGAPALDSGAGASGTASGALWTGFLGAEDGGAAGCSGAASGVVAACSDALTAAGAAGFTGGKVPAPNKAGDAVADDGSGSGLLALLYRAFSRSATSPWVRRFIASRSGGAGLTGTLARFGSLPSEPGSG